MVLQLSVELRLIIYHFVGHASHRQDFLKSRRSLMMLRIACKQIKNELDLIPFKSTVFNFQQLLLQTTGKWSHSKFQEQRGRLPRISLKAIMSVEVDLKQIDTTSLISPIFTVLKNIISHLPGVKTIYCHPPINQRDIVRDVGCSIEEEDQDQGPAWEMEDCFDARNPAWDDENGPWPLDMRLKFGKRTIDVYFCEPGLSLVPLTVASYENGSRVTGLNG
jgi:hypothetical protein